MTPAADRPTVPVGGPADLLAAVPYLLGFHPISSLVVVCLVGRSALNVARMDLPADPDDMPQMAAALHRLAVLANNHGVTAAILIGYGTAGQVNPSLRQATATLTAASIPIKEVLRADAGRYWSYLCDNPNCCPPDGVAFEPATTVAAAAATAAGLVALPDRQAVAARLTPVTAAARDRMAAATATAVQTLRTLTAAADRAGTDRDTTSKAPSDMPGRAAVAAGRRYLDIAHQRYRTGAPIDDDHAALLTVLLTVPQVRAYAARRTTAAHWQIDMWVDLVRRAQPEFVVNPAIMLTLSALQAGLGALADIAVQRALQADPTDQLANLLAMAVATGIDPATVTALLTG